MRGISPWGKILTLGLGIKAVMVFLLYDISCNNSHFCNTTVNEIMKIAEMFINAVAKGMNQISKIDI